MAYSILLKTGSLGDAIQELLLAHYTILNALSRTNCLIASENIQKQMWPSCQLRIWQGFKVIVMILTLAKCTGLLHVFCFKPVCRFSACRICLFYPSLRISFLDLSRNLPHPSASPPPTKHTENGWAGGSYQTTFDLNTL